MKGKYTVLLVITLLFGCTLTGYAQNKTVTGTVTDAQTGDPLPGVNILEMGTSNGAATNSKGHYSLQVESLQDTLRFSFIGYKTQTVPINGRTTINIKLSSTVVVSGNQLVVIGFGTQKKSDLSSSIATFSTQQITTNSVLPNTAAALEGLSPGVSVTTASGSPGSNINIRVRGTSSFGNNQPLVIIDGTRGSLSDVDPSDIESLQVLKDAAAAAIYGSRAANGVIIVKTKHGTSGKTKVNIKSSYGVQQPTTFIPLLDARQYAKVDNELHKSVGLPPFDALKNPESLGAGSMWQHIIYHRAPIINDYMAISGGSENSTYRISGKFEKQNGILKHTWFRKGNLRYSGQQEAGHFTFGESLAWNETNRRVVPAADVGATGGVIQEVMLDQPVIPVHDSTHLGGFGGAPAYLATQGGNPLGDLVLKKHTIHNNSFHAAVHGQFDFLRHFSYKIIAGYNVINTYDYNYTPTYFFSNQRLNNHASLSENRGRTHQWILNNTLNYKQQFGKNNVSVLAGFTTQELHNRFTIGSRSGFPNNSLQVLSAGTGFSINSEGSDNRWDLVSLLGRVLYNYNEKYYLTANVRRDGSSKFGSTNRYGVFPSASIAWRISNENFFKPIKDVLTNLKFRASYGMLGNLPSNANGTPLDYAYIPTLSFGPSLGYLFAGGYEPGATQLQFVNPNVKWETTKDLDIGANIEFLNNIHLTFDYFLDKTDNLLLNVPIPPSTGTTTAPLVNTGKVQNQGVEFSVTYNAHPSNSFNYNISGHVSMVHNKVLKLGFAGQVIHGTAPYRAPGGPITVAKVGFPIGSFFMKQDLGIFQNQQEIDNYTHNGKLIQPNAEPGDIKYEDVNHDGKITAADVRYSGSPFPKFAYGLNFNANYKNFDFTVFILGEYGRKMFDAQTWLANRMTADYNHSTDLLDAWTPDNRDTDIPRLTFNDPNGDVQPSTRFLHNATYLRFKTVQIGYTFPQKILSQAGLGKLRIFVSIHNLWTITKYTGYDPSYTGDGLLNRGLDQGRYPVARLITGGININF
jgi:TonB-linked SusC/RagA family outer membrane protein